MDEEGDEGAMGDGEEGIRVRGRGIGRGHTSKRSAKRGWERWM